MTELNGQRILILEEQASIAQRLVEMIEGLNCKAVGPVDRLPQALALLVECEVDAAILDVKIEGEPSYPVAEDLIRRGIPWAFASSNPTDELARRYPSVPVITKPYSSEHLSKVLAQLLAGPPT
jgi:CheY-like chemotaxis protein